jgi:hypothetical protein
MSETTSSYISDMGVERCPHTGGFGQGDFGQPMPGTRPIVPTLELLRTSMLHLTGVRDPALRPPAISPGVGVPRRAPRGN